MPLWSFFQRPAPPQTFTGNCLVLQHTGDGAYVGRCWHATYNGRCHLHGDVSRWLDSEYMDWPRDYELAQIDS